MKINNFPPGYAELYLNIMNYDVCSQSTDFFTRHRSHQNCESFFSNSTSYVIINKIGIKNLTYSIF